MGLIQDTDLLLVNRGGTSYSTEFAELKEILSPEVKILKPELLSPSVVFTSEIIDVVDPGVDTGESWDVSVAATNGGLNSISRFSTSIGSRTVAFDRATGLFWYNDTQDLKTNWQQSSSALTINANAALMQGDGLILAIGRQQDGELYTSTDGDTWTQITSNLPSRAFQAGFYCTADKCFYASHLAGVYKSEPNDPTTWTNITGEIIDGRAGFELFEVITETDYYVYTSCNEATIEGGVYRSTNGEPFVHLKNDASIGDTQAAYGNGYLIYFTDETDGYQTVYLSTDYGETWISSPTSFDLFPTEYDSNSSATRGLAFFDGEFYMIGYAYDSLNTTDLKSFLWKSTDGITWTEIQQLGGLDSVPTFNPLSVSAFGLMIAAARIDGVADGGFFVSASSSTTLTFATDENFSEFEVNGIYRDNTKTKSAQVLAKDAAQRVMIVNTKDSFTANAGETLISNDLVDVDPDGLIFTATPYEDTPDNATQPDQAIWEVATSPDFTTGLMTDTKAATRDTNNSLTPAERVNISLANDTTYWVRVTYTSSSGEDPVASEYQKFTTEEDSAPAPVPPGSQVFSNIGSHTWTCPSDVTSVCVVAVGGGGAYRQAGGSRKTGGGGGLGWKNNIPVVPGQNYTVVVGRGGLYSGGLSGENSYFIDETTVMGGGAGAGDGNHSTAGTFVGDGGGNGGTGRTDTSTSRLDGGGGAGGYSGNGGAGATDSGSVDGAAGQGGGGGGGAASWCGGGGGVGIFGQGANGAGGVGSSNTGSAGKGGSGGTDGSKYNDDLNKVGGGEYGGGAAAGNQNGTYQNDGGQGAVRIVWGDGRAFPNTDVSAATTSLFETSTNSVISLDEAKRKYGVSRPTPELGLYGLTNEAYYPVAEYVRVNNLYEPIRDFSQEIQYRTAQLATLQTQVAAAYSAIIPEPIAVNGYYPLYNNASEAIAASADGTYHMHIIDGLDYYMPDTGVTIYHGDYVAPSDDSGDSDY